MRRRVVTRRDRGRERLTPGENDRIRAETTDVATRLYADEDWAGP